MKLPVIRNVSFWRVKVEKSVFFSSFNTLNIINIFKKFQRTLFLKQNAFSFLWLHKMNWSQLRLRSLHNLSWLKQDFIISPDIYLSQFELYMQILPPFIMNHSLKLSWILIRILNEFALKPQFAPLKKSFCMHYRTIKLNLIMSISYD